MASSQTKPKVESSMRLLRNPLQLLKKKGPIVPALGHVFDGELTCSHCGRMWHEQRSEPTSCGPDPETAAPSPGDDDLSGES